MYAENNIRIISYVIKKKKKLDVNESSLAVL